MSIRSFITNSLKRFSGLDANQQQLLANYAQRWDESADSSGLHINIHSGLRLDTVYTAIKRIADSVASTPSPVFQYLDRGRDKAKSHPVYKALNVKANKDQTSFTWKHLTAAHLLGWGNSFSEIERDNAGRVLGLNPMHPNDVKIAGRAPGTQELVYQWTNNEGKVFYFAASDVLHIRGMSFDGIMGLSPIMQLRQLVGRAAAREEFQTRFYANGAVLGGVISTPNELTDEALARYRKSFDELYRGPKNSGKFLLLEGASKFDSIGVNPRDAQFIESSKLDAARIAAVFGIPMQFLNEVETTTRASAEQLFREFLALGLNTIFSNMEQQFNVALFTETEQDTFYVEFMREALIQSDFATLIKGLTDEISHSMLTPNEAREVMNKNPLPGGDVLMAPVNYVPLEQLGQSTQPPNLPTPPSKNSVRSVQKHSKSDRKKIIKAQQSLLQDAFDRVGKRERQDLLKAIHKNSFDPKSFDTFLTDFYKQDGDFTTYFSKSMKPLVGSTSEHVRNDVADQLDTDLQDDSEFASEYLDTMCLRYTSSSQRQLQKVLEDLSEGENAADALEERLSEWEQGTTDVNPSRPEKESQNEAIRMVNAMARAYMALGGVTKLIWSGGDCPLCQELDGQVVGIEESFVDQGDDVGDMKAESDVFHPPLHQGCNCEINPS